MVRYASTVSGGISCVKDIDVTGHHHALDLPARRAGSDGGPRRGNAAADVALAKLLKGYEAGEMQSVLLEWTNCYHQRMIKNQKLRQGKILAVVVATSCLYGLFSSVLLLPPELA